MKISQHDMYFGPSADRSPNNATNWPRDKIDRALTFPSMANAAGATGISKGLLQFAKQSGSPGFHANGTVCVTAVLRWLVPQALVNSVRGMNANVEDPEETPPGED